MPVLAAQWHLGQVFLTMLWFFLFVIWIWLLITVFIDIFRSHDLGGFAKALWVIFVVIAPYLGVFVYLIARGHKMADHALEAAQAQDRGHACLCTCGGGLRDEHRRRARTPGGSEGAGRDRRRRVPAAQGEGPRLTGAPEFTPFG